MPHPVHDLTPEQVEAYEEGRALPDDARCPRWPGCLCWIERMVEECKANGDLPS